MDMVVARVRGATRADYRAIIALLEAEDEFDPHIWRCEEAYQRGSLRALTGRSPWLTATASAP